MDTGTTSSEDCGSNFSGGEITGLEESIEECRSDELKAAGVLQDQITAFEGNTGTVQFSEGGGGGGVPASGGNATAAAATPPALPGSLATPPPAAAPPTGGCFPRPQHTPCCSH